MSSFLANCPQCGVTYAAGSPCPSCRWVDADQHIPVQDGEFCEEFKIRSRRQKSNTTVQMFLLAGTGFIAFATAAMWAAFIFRGSILAFIAVGFLTVVSGVMGWCTYLAKSRYPTSLFCPGCDSDVSDLGMEFYDCPACGVNLVAREGTQNQIETVDLEDEQFESELPAEQEHVTV